MKIKILLFSACIAFCYSCEKDDPVDHATTITLHATIGKQKEDISRTTSTDGTGTHTAFSDGDVLGLFATGTLKRNPDLSDVINLPFTMDKEKWEEATPKLKWQSKFENYYEGMDISADIYAYFPYQEDLTNGYEIFDNSKKVLQDVLMAERTTVQNNNPAIFLTFKHRFSLIQLSLGTGLDAVTETDIIAAVMDKSISDKALIDDGIITLKEDAEKGINEFQPIKKGANYYIVIPCEKFENDSIKFTHVRIGDGEDVYSKLATPIIPQPNTKYNLKVHKGIEGSISVELGDIELWGNNTSVGSIREEAGLYSPSDLVNMINSYNANPSKTNTNLEKYGIWNEEEQYWEFSLMSNLDMKDVSATSRGSMINDFLGVFDGRGYTITGLDIEGPGFFGTIKDGSEVKNLTLKDISVQGIGTNTGALAGVVEPGTTIHNCNVEGTSTVVGNGNTGGLIGDCNGDVTRSSSSADVKNGTSPNAGGLIGHLGSDGTINNSQAISNVTSDGDNVGGLVGNSEGTINDSYSACKVNGKNNVGGLVGESAALIQNCYAVGSVEGEEYVGGLTGYTTALIQQSVTDGTVKGNNAVGGMVGYSHSGIEESSTRATVSGTTNIGGFIGEATAATSITNCYVTNQKSFIGNTIEGDIITYSYEIGSGEGNPEKGYFCIPLDAEAETINEILDKLNQNEGSAKWTLSKIIIGDKVYSLPVLTNK